MSDQVYEIRPRSDKRGVNLISDKLPFGRLWYGEPNAVSNAVSYAKFYSRSHDAVIRVYDSAGNVIDTHEHAGEFKEWRVHFCPENAARLLSMGKAPIIRFRGRWPYVSIGRVGFARARDQH